MVERRKAILIAVSLGTLTSGMNTSIVNTILPEVQRDLGISLSAVQWIATVYVIILSSLQLPMGRLGDLVGYKKVFQTGLALFALFSLLTGLADTLWFLLLCRVLQGVGGAMIVAMTPALLTVSFPSSQRGKGLAVFFTMTYVGMSVGPFLGGFLTHWFGWSYAFYINVPLALLALFFGRRLAETQVQRSVRFDFLGGALFLLFLSCLTLSINRGFATEWHTFWVGLFLFSLVMGFLFFQAERKMAAPMLDVKLLGNRVISLSVFASVINYTVVFFFYFLMPVYLVNGMGMGIAQAGLIITLKPVVMIVVSMVSGRISDRIGPRIPATSGLAALALGMLLLAIFVPMGSFSGIFLAIILVGIGVGFFTTPNNSAVIGATPPEMRGVAAGISGTARYIGVAIGLILSSSLYESLQHFFSGKPFADAAAFQWTLAFSVLLAVVGMTASFFAVDSRRITRGKEEMPEMGTGR